MEKAIHMFNNFNLNGRQLIANIVRPRKTRSHGRNSSKWRRGRKHSNRDLRPKSRGRLFGKSKI